MTETFFARTLRAIAPKSVEQIETSAKAAEAPLAFGDPADGSMWRGSGNSALTPSNEINYHKFLRTVERLLQTNGMFRRITEIIRDHVCGDGIERKVTARDKSLKKYEKSIHEILDEFWFDPRNNLEVNVPSYVFEDAATGEICLPVNVHEGGYVTIGYIPPRLISNVNLIPFNSAEVHSIQVHEGSIWKTRKGGKRNPPKDYLDWTGGEREFFPIRISNDMWERNTDGSIAKDENGIPKGNPNYGRLAGDVFYARNNNVIGSLRGVGDLFHVIDLVNYLDNAIELNLERYEIENAMVLDITVDGGAGDVANAQKEMSIPKAPVPWIHNKKISGNIIAPPQRQGDFATFMEKLTVLIGGSAGIPEFMLGYGGNTNVATAKEQAPALYAKFKNRRTRWQSILSQILRFVVERANEAGRIYETTTVDGVETKGATRKLTHKELSQISIDAVFMPFERSNAQSNSEVLQSVAEAVDILVQKEHISKKTAKQIVRAQVGQMGLTIDAEDEEATIASEKANKTTVKGTDQELPAVDFE